MAETYGRRRPGFIASFGALDGMMAWRDLRSVLHLRRKILSCGAIYVDGARSAICFSLLADGSYVATFPMHFSHIVLLLENVRATAMMGH